MGRKAREKAQRIADGITRKDLTGTYKTISGSKYLRFTVKEKNSGAGDRD